MTNPEEDRDSGYGWLPFAVLAVALVRSMSSLVEAWGHDVYSRGAAVAFAIWVLPAFLPFLRKPPQGGGFFWLILALVSGVAGAVSSLRILSHLSLAFSIAAVARPHGLRIVWVCASVAWLPASGWLLSKLHGGGFSGWERPVLSLLSTLVFLIPARKPLASNLP